MPTPKSTSSSGAEKKTAVRKTAAAKPRATTAKKKPETSEAAVAEKPKKTRAKAVEVAEKPEVAPVAPVAAAPAPAPTPIVAPAPAVVVPPVKEVAKEVPVAVAPEASPAAAPSDSQKLIHHKGPIVVKDLAEKLGIKSFQLIHHLMELNVFASLTQTIEAEVANKVCVKLGWTLEVETRKKGEGLVHAPVKVVEPPKPVVVKEAELEFRPPIITFMGHVDHGKTSLMDAIRKTRVVAGEAGGITQHIGAYTVVHEGKTISFLDTPGHAAFTAMRARGANLTDIVVLVVAADDGIMPQTEEAISHARAAKVPIIVAINKIDAPGANPMRVKGQLQEKGLAPEEYGGETICVEVSATKKLNIDKLLEYIQLQAEILELKANSKGAARGRVVEAQTEVGRGPTATVIVQTGTLQLGDNIIAGRFYGRVKGLVNDAGQSVKEAGPSIPVKVLGFDGVPLPGEEFVIMKNDKEARQLADERQQKLRLEKLEAPPKVTLENLFETIADGQKKVLHLIIRGDTQGSVEAIIGSLRKIESKKVDLDIVQSGVGPVTESDILLAKASSAILVGFNSRTENSAANAAKREGVQIKLYSIIYELLDQMKEAMAGLLDPELRESKVGTAIVKKVFELSTFPVAGCLVQNGRLVRSARARVLRRGQPLYDGAFLTLKRFQDEVGEVRSGVECGIRLGDFDDYQEDDLIECYQLEKFPQAL